MKDLLAIMWLAFDSSPLIECRAIDASESQLGFEIRQDGLPLRGGFERFGGELCLQGETLIGIEGWLDVTSVVAGMAEIERAIRSADVLDAASFPRATFASERIERHGDDYSAHGVLELRGVARSIDVPFRLLAGEDGARAEGSFTLDRLAFGIGDTEWPDESFLGREVTVTFSLRLK